jgi:hypothetical protein
LTGRGLMAPDCHLSSYDTQAEEARKDDYLQLRDRRHCGDSVATGAAGQGR